MRVALMIGAAAVGAAGALASDEAAPKRDFLAERAALVASVVPENPAGSPVWDRVAEALQAIAISEMRTTQSLRLRYGMDDDVEIDADPLLLIDAPPEEAKSGDKPEAVEADEVEKPFDMEAARLEAARALMRTYEQSRMYGRFALLRTQPFIRIPLDGRPLIVRDLSYAHPSTLLAKLEAVRMWRFLEAGDSRKAAHSLEGILALGVVLSREPTMMGRVSSVDAFDAAYETLRRWIGRHPLDAVTAGKMLAAADKRLAQFTPLSYTLAGERLTGLDTIGRVYSLEVAPPLVMVKGEAKEIRSLEENEAAITTLYDATDAWASTPAHERRERHPTPSEVVADMPEGLVLVKLIAEGLGQSAWMNDAARVEMGGMRLMLALEAWRAEKGAYPEELDALVPDYLEGVPEDPYAPDGRYRYRKPSGGGAAPAYILSSVGHDGMEGQGARPQRESTLLPGEIGMEADYLICAPKRGERDSGAEDAEGDASGGE